MRGMGDKARELGGWWDRLVAIDGVYGEIKEWSFGIRLKISLARKNRPQGVHNHPDGVCQAIGEKQGVKC